MRLSVLFESVATGSNVARRRPAPRRTLRDHGPPPRFPAMRRGERLMPVATTCYPDDGLPGMEFPGKIGIESQGSCEWIALDTLPTVSSSDSFKEPSHEGTHRVRWDGLGGNRRTGLCEP